MNIIHYQPSEASSTKSTERSELDEVNHVWFHQTIKNKLYTDEINMDKYFIAMKRIFLVLIALLISSRFVNCQPGNDTLNLKPDVTSWVKNIFAKNRIPPFSFDYGGKNSDSFIIKWDYKADLKESSDPNIEEFVFTYTDRKTGLSVKCFVTSFNDFQAAEWVLKFLNNSTRNTPVIENVKAIKYNFNYNKDGAFILHHAKGSTSVRSDFRPFDDELKTGESVYMTPDAGRSSEGNMAFPFFNIESPANEGVMVAIGWTGKWFARVIKKDEKSVSLESGMERMKLILYPKEEIRTPKICLLFWKGNDRMVGHNQFRRFILAHHTRMINGKPSGLPLSAFLAREGPPPCNEHTCATESYSIALINRFRQFNIVPEVFWLDAGWYPNKGDWHNVGSWIVNRENFPNGLKPVTDAAHNAGAKFLLWFEPERVREETLLSTEHPEWLVKIQGSQTSLLNLGNKDALRWLTNHISDMIRKEGIDIYRQDFNMDPLPYWEKSDQPQREGISEIRHIEGLYAFWDTLLARFPNMIIDNCASGGRRIDLETISRSSPFWRTDFNGYTDPNGCQDNTYGLNFYLPLHGTANYVRSQYYFRSNMSSSLVLNWDISTNDHTIPEMQEYISDFKRLRPYYSGDYYPLTGTKGLLQNNTWLAYQLNRPEQNDGIILAFRREGSSDETIPVKLKGLDEKMTYELYYEDYGIKTDRCGDELMKGIDITIPMNPGSLLISYKIKK
jgi:alpha-galactosidase